MAKDWLVETIEGWTSKVKQWTSKIEHLTHELERVNRHLRATREDMAFYYLATPYSQYHDGLHAAFKLACVNAALLMRAGIPVFSPIAHGHSIVMDGDLHYLDETMDSCPDGFWDAANHPLLDAATGLIVLTAPGWEHSAGIASEIWRAKRICKPILHMTPGIVPDKLVGARRLPAHEGARA